MNNLEKALVIATKAHVGQFDKNGVDYIEHPKKVASYVETEEEKIVALLHDVVEDTDITLDFLKKEGFGEEIIKAIDVLTKKFIQSEEEYYNLIKKNELAKKVKIADLKHNSMIARYNKPTIQNIDKCIHYLENLKKLI